MKRQRILMNAYRGVERNAGKHNEICRKGMAVAKVPIRLKSRRWFHGSWVVGMRGEDRIPYKQLDYFLSLVAR